MRLFKARKSSENIVIKSSSLSNENDLQQNNIASYHHQKTSLNTTNKTVAETNCNYRQLAYNNIQLLMVNDDIKCNSNSYTSSKKTDNNNIKIISGYINNNTYHNNNNNINNNVYSKTNVNIKKISENNVNATVPLIGQNGKYYKK